MLLPVPYGSLYYNSDTIKCVLSSNHAAATMFDVTVTFFIANFPSKVPIGVGVNKDAQERGRIKREPFCPVLSSARYTWRGD